MKLLSVGEQDTSAQRFPSVLKVAIRCFGGMREYLPSGAEGNRALIDLPETADVSTAIDALGVPRQHVFAVLVDGGKSDLRTPLHDGAEVVLMPPFSGGERAAALVTISDGVASGEREDRSGEAVAKLLQDGGFAVAEHTVIPDVASDIEEELRRLVAVGIPLVCTTGGTGLAPRDVTPEATSRVLEREAPGIAELMRTAGLTETKRAALSRGKAGTAASTLILNLPGSPRGATSSLQAVLDILDHALDLVAGNTRHDEHLPHQ